MADDAGDEIPVRVVDPTPLEDIVELRIRGVRGAVWQLLGVLKHGGEQAAIAGENGHPGWRASAAIALGVLEQAEPAVGDVEDADDFGTGTMGSLDPDELRDLLDVEYDVLERASGDRDRGRGRGGGDDG